ncbi:type VII secretion protein EccB [Streptomyces sp. 8K308]|uniref:type VII secretion protein EccB n=1 Tax=Streptomyces sp. 8K308 TaxID=2530388 RepID=UPI0010499DEE|nr:type VII secretion protein EccB [Streptomyces sp. 8K308]TDC20847.1 type VII secretion protein EccB [Streptomyces sp. 8K308]
MASRKDELNAYTFAKRRTVAAFLQPSPTGTEEGAPRPLRAVVPGMVVGALVLVGFGAWGLFRPAVPQGWDEPGRNVIIGSDSTTRYVVLETEGGGAQLHPVLNLSSARLLLGDPAEVDIVSVDEAELDSGAIPRGPTLGIPYAPDRLPSAEEAADAKRWAVCQQPDGRGGYQQAAFVLADRDADRVEGRQRLAEGEVLYVRSTEDDGGYLVDRTGTKYPIGETDPTNLAVLLRLLTDERPPQPVSEEWLDTLADGSPIAFPRLDAPVGTPAGVPGLEPAADLVGMVLTAATGSGPQNYLVLPGQVVPITEFTAHLMLNSPHTVSLGQRGTAFEVSAPSLSPAPPEQSIDHELDWPRTMISQVNGPERDTVCSVLLSVDPDDGSTEVATWAGSEYPATIASGAATAYVTPGSGLLYRQVQGGQAEAGGVFLVTDTGLRYSVQATATGTRAEEQAQIKLGYGDVTPVPVPAHWSRFLPTGPRLDLLSASRPQGS